MLEVERLQAPSEKPAPPGCLLSPRSSVRLSVLHGPSAGARENGLQAARAVCGRSIRVAEGSAALVPRREGSPDPPERLQHPTAGSTWSLRWARALFVLDGDLASPWVDLALRQFLEPAITPRDGQG
jgi:hypothetical protein